MSGSDPFFLASLAAEQIVIGLNIVALPVDPRKIATDRDIVVVAKPIEENGVSGMLIRSGNDFAIAYATHHQNEGFENFSIGHELGHFYLPGHVNAIIEGDEGVHVSRAGFNSGNRYEAEADRFSAGLLMPRHLFFPAMQHAGKGLAAIEGLARLCKTSLHATAIRYVQCSREPVAIIVSKAGVIDHCVMSEALKQINGIDWVRKHQFVPRDTPTFSFNMVFSNIELSVRIEEKTNLQTWFGGTRNIEVSEDVIGLGRYGKTLTVLYDIDIPEPEDEEEESNLIDSWTPRF